MFSSAHLITLALLLASLFLASATANPLPGFHPAVGTLHSCSVYMQRWVAADNTWDVYVFDTATNSAGQACGPFTANCNQIDEVETTEPTPVGDQLPSPGPGGVPGDVGSYPLDVTNVADPVNNNDGGKLSFVWGSEIWDNFSSGNPCTTTPVGDAGAAEGGATTIYCPFQCDAA